MKTAIAIALAPLLAACSLEPESIEARSQASATVDDGGHALDATYPQDASHPLDAAYPVDAAVDASYPHDASYPWDAGPWEPWDAGSDDEWYQPNCVDERLSDQDGEEDGEVCLEVDVSLFCLMVSDCPNWCVSCEDGTTQCYPCDEP